MSCVTPGQQLYLEVVIISVTPGHHLYQEAVMTSYFWTAAVLRTCPDKLILDSCCSWKFSQLLNIGDNSSILAGQGWLGRQY